MKRLLIIVLLFAVALVVTLPGAVGYFAERGHDRLGLGLPGDQLTEERYERGWFSSDTQHRYRIEDERLRKVAAAITGEPSGNAELVVISRIYHGPVPLLAGGSTPLAWTDVDSSLVLRAPSGAEIALPGELRSRLQADGSTRFRYHADAETRALRDGLTLTWDDSDVDLTLSRDADRMAVSAAVGKISVADDTAGMSIGPTTIKGEQRRGRSGLWTGDAVALIESLSAPEFETGGVRLESHVRESDSEVNYTLLIDAVEIQVGRLSGRNAHIDATVQRLDANAFGDLLALIEAHRDAGSLPPLELDAVLARLLLPGPELTLRKLTVPTAGADLEAEAFVSVTPATGTGIRELAGGIEGNTTLLVPMALIERIEEAGTEEVRTAIDLMRRFRFLVPEDNRYRIEAAYAGGLLTVNGFPIPVPVF